MNIVLAPDVYVNASVTLGSAPDHAVRRALSKANRTKASEWVLERVESMLHATPGFKPDAVETQIGTIRDLVDVLETPSFYIEDWETALITLAKKAGVHRVLTDHPDLLTLGMRDGIEFVSTEAWLVEQTTPPPPPG